VINEAVLWRLVLRLERAEERLLRAEDLNRRRGVLGEVDQRPRVRYEARAYELADEEGEVWGDGLHAVLEVLEQLAAVAGEGDDLIA
jgi:hypothetical protein